MGGGGDALKKRFFGKEVEIKTEAAVIGISALVLLGCLVGYIFFRDRSGIIIEARHGTQAQTGIENLSKIGGSGKEEASGGAGTSRKGDGSGTAATKGVQGVVGSGVSIGGSDSMNADSNSGNAAETPLPPEMIKVYVVGCVKSPGIVTIEKGQMIYDAVALAGGLTEDADADNINMVYKLNENVMLYIKSNKEAEQKDNAKKGENAIVVKESGDSAIVIGDGDEDNRNEQEESKPRLVNINTADIAELDTLPGVGEATAKDIITFREKNEGFRRIEDIMKVPRIKQNRFERIKDYITVE